jgi:Zn-dependent peptidase ImmA (M78 family)
MSLRRGFKAEANRISLRLRTSLGLTRHSPINLTALGDKLGIRVVPLSNFKDECPDAVQHLNRKDRSAFSAATVPLPDGRHVILFNDSHSKARCQSNIAHEIAHIVLGHEFTLPIDNTGTRVFDRDVEDEANWLGPAILISNEAALHILRSALSTEAACAQYGVSAAVLRMRINASGARIRLQRSIH